MNQPSDFHCHASHPWERECWTMIEMECEYFASSEKEETCVAFFLQDQVFGNSENGVSKNVLDPPMGI